MDHQALLKQFEYLNHMNPHTFEVEDLDRLIRSVNVDARCSFILNEKYNDILKVFVPLYSGVLQ